MQIYIAGKITGLDPTKCYVAFKNAEKWIARSGHTPLNPRTMVDQAEGREYGEYLADALQILLTQADAVYFLSNFRDSRGARIEQNIANELELPCYFELDQLPEVK